MKRCLKTILILFSIILILPTLATAAQYKVTRVYDGDTILGVGHDITIKVRLVGIDAPERSRNKRDPGQPYSQQATKHLSGLVLNKVVDIKGYGLDRYNRILGEIYLNGKNINLEMVQLGLSEVYNGRHPKDFIVDPYLIAERKAKTALKGIWGQRGKYISPQEWRKEH